MAIHLSDHFTYKKIFKAVLSPILMMVFISIYSIVDGLFVSNFVGTNAFAAINFIMPVTMGIGALGFMMGAGGSALVSMKLGEGKKEQANRIFSGIVLFTIILGVVVSLAVVFFVEPISLLLGATEEMLPYCVSYGRIIIIGEVAFMLQNLFQSFFIVAEKSGFGFLTSVVAGVMNMVLDALFILGFKMGVDGAALATILSQVGATIFPIIYFSRKNSSLLKFKKPDLNFRNITKAIANGSSEFLSNISSSVVGIVFNLQLLKYSGESGVAAYGVIMYIGFIYSAIFIGYAIGTAPIISYHYGAENYDEVKNILKKSVIVNIVLGVLMTIISVVLARVLSSIFVGYDVDLLNLTASAMRIYSICFIILGVNMFTSSFFTALNNGLISAIISAFRTLVCQIGAVLLLPIAFGINGIWAAVIVSELGALILGVIFLFVYRKRYKY